MLLGCHLSISGGLEQTVARAQELQINALQIFSHNARSWKMGALKPDEAKKFIEQRQRGRIEYAVIHTIYLINLASPDPKNFQLSVQALKDELQRAGELNIPHVNTHIGAHMGQGIERGLERVVEAIDAVLASPQAQRASTVKILLENSAGEGTELGATFAELGFVLRHVKQKERVGVCLDTCHAFAAGYDLTTPDGLEKTLAELDREVGLKRVALLHLNDSKFPLGARKDRHEHIGQGHIGIEGFRLIVNHKDLREKPFILETPKDDEQSDPKNLAAIRALRYDN
ncbi:MAG: deoxyribonuclease IV [Candidatus Bipolaricaulota bacterium]|nr:deoxyribonuclease IV [Candidatus Bipolaricaulota bacterium]MCS7274378.1 deoxyribonuclease IV [Candidatus Bipolaricaulota bacterium]MDW8111557.1 deoxyribonuclease IV [Candidatus Bipolaricaulota bacterium]